MKVYVHLEIYNTDKILYNKKKTSPILIKNKTETHIEILIFIFNIYLHFCVKEL